MPDEKTTEEIAQDYTAMGHSVELINAIIQEQQWQMMKQKTSKTVLIGT